MRRVAPAVALFFLSPLVAEFLLGDFTIAVLPFVLVLAPMYGGGALLIREVVRRTGRGWPSTVLLALAFGVLEEGITTQSLFDPDYAGAHLLEHGYVPALGIAVPWTIYVLGLHAVWSISVPTALVEEWTSRRETPWLRTPGLVVVSALLLLGSVGTTAQSYGTDHFVASWQQLTSVVVVVLALVVAAFLVPRRVRPSQGGAPATWTVLVAALVAGALFQLSTLDAMPTAIGVLMMLVAAVGIVVAVLAWSRRESWGAWHRLALAAGGLLTYAWHSFFTTPLVGGGAVMTPLSHTVLALAAVALLLVIARRVRAQSVVSERSMTTASVPPR